MVRRSDRAVGDATRKKATGGLRGRRQQRGKRNGNDDDMLEVQEKGVLKLNNPLIPPELDEDIDDDIAFNSEDEEKYGHLFRKKSASDTARLTAGAKRKNGTRKKKVSKHAADVEETGDADDALLLQQLRALGEIEDGDDLDFHERDGAGDDDDYIDLVDMLDAGQGEEREAGDKKQKKKKKKKLDESGVAKKRRRALVTEEAESLYGLAATDDKYGSAIRQLVTATPASSTQSRMQKSLENKRNLISVDVDEHTKAKVTRREVRKVVSDELAKYNSFLREQREAKHLQFPMPMPDSNPVPTTLGAISVAAQERFTTQENAAGTAAALATTTTTTDATGVALGTTGNASRVSAFRLAGKVNALLSSAGLSRPELTAPSAEDVFIPLDGNDDDNGGANRAAAAQNEKERSVPTKSYMAKLKAMLSYENARRRRLNRIKSKTYRRILRKEKDREKERREKAFEILHPEKARARLAEKLMRARVEERVTQKHKNTSKWVRHAKRFANFDGNTKDAINEQNLLHQRLMQKMEEDADEDAYLNAHVDGHADSEAASSEEERVVDYLMAEVAAKQQQEGGNKTEKSSQKLTSVLWRSIAEVEKEGEDDGQTTGSQMTPTEKARMELREMNFMQQAKEREEKRYAEVLETLQEDIRRDMCGQAVGSDDEPSDLDETSEKEEKPKRLKSKAKSLKNVETNVGRKVFLQRHGEQPDRKVVESIQLKRHRGIDAQRGNEAEETHRNTSAKEDANGTGRSTRDEGSNDGVADGMATEKDKAATFHTADLAGSRDEKNEGFAGSRQPNISSVSNVGSEAVFPATPKRASSTRITILPADAKRPRDVNGTNKGEEEGVLRKAKGKRKKREQLGEKKSEEENDEETTLQQHQEYLIARAFADDEVDAEFLAEKTAQVETIMKPVDKNATLPGWGEWGGKDERLNRHHQEKLKLMDLQRQIEKTTLMKSRADAELDHVIINHDGVELVPDRMLLHMIPRPFSNPTEFARSMRHPLGPEWNSAFAFKEANQPRLEVRQGHSMLPLDLTLRGKKKTAKTKRRKVLSTAAV
ncbi:hypothetical protein C3747_2g529 [Trypanosoma cruzi]|uniref:U3 small nucleolar RNA-associated protein 14 n=2 Tax=Trypanosoma cruzi TaxID=5693 RepID=A0A2V2XLV9_TRYCR|nr:hypothetical protein C3747_2g529 [Trypanosoma cruzi]